QIPVNDLLTVRRSNARANRFHQFHCPRQRHRSFISHDFVEGLALNEFHYQKGHRFCGNAKVRHADDVLMSNGGGRQRFLTKAFAQVGVVTDQIGKNDLDGVQSFQEDMTGFEDQAHPAATQTLFQLIAAVENWLSRHRPSRRSPVRGTVTCVIRQTAATGWTLSHSWSVIAKRASLKGVRKNSSGCKVVRARMRVFAGVLVWVFM